MNATWLLPVLLGSFAVLQAGINRQISLQWGLPATVLFNNFVLFIVSMSFYLWTQSHPQWGPELFHPKHAFQGFKLWYLLPGLMGFSLVAGIPFSMDKMGALKVFIFLIGAQLAVSLLWDRWVMQIPIEPIRIVGALLTFLGAYLVMGKGMAS